MKTIKLILPVLIALSLLFATSCSKDEGFDSKKEISGRVSYTDGVAAGAIVSVTFGASASNGNVDFTTTTGADGTYSFGGLEKGDYYMDATYTDPRGFVFETAGAHVEIKNTKKNLTVDFVLQ
jgi:hypothetical protein